MAAWPGPFYRGSAVLSALRDLFDQFEAEQQAKQSRGKLGAGKRTVIDPTPLREALAALPQGHLFAQGGLSCAAGAAGRGGAHRLKACLLPRAVQAARAAQWSYS